MVCFCFTVPLRKGGIGRCRLRFVLRGISHAAGAQPSSAPHKLKIPAGLGQPVFSERMNGICLMTTTAAQTRWTALSIACRITAIARAHLARVPARSHAPPGRPAQQAPLVLRVLPALPALPDAPAPPVPPDNPARLVPLVPPAPPRRMFSPLSPHSPSGLPMAPRSRWAPSPPTLPGRLS